MGKKRKPRAVDTEPEGPRNFDPKDARLGPIATFEDVANSEDEYFLNQDKILFDEEPKSKRRKRQEDEDEFLELSDEEVIAYHDDDSGEEDKVDEVDRGKKLSKKAEEQEDEGLGEEEGDEGWWGSSRKDYYDADEIEDEADALEEEAEAKRLQRKKLSKMVEEDFLFEGNEWLESKPDTAAEEVVTEVLKEVDVTEDMGPEERYQLLQTRYPEFEHLVNEFLELQPLLPALQKEARGKTSKSIEAVKYWVLGSYLAALASYFGILTSPARDTSGANKPLDPAELRDHEVMETLIGCRETWQKVKDMTTAIPVNPSREVPSLEEATLLQEEITEPVSKRKSENKSDKASDEKATRKKKYAMEVEESLADLSSLLQKPRKSKAQAANGAAALNWDGHSDFGEEEEMDARTAADKAARKKSLRFYTSQIAQKSNRRAEAGREAGGDMDIPYRERLKDRQARLNAEAERRGLKGSKHGVDLDPEAGDDDDAEASAIRDNEDEYYDMIASASKEKKADKAAYHDTLAQASITDRVVETEVIGEDGKRKVTYAIEKNKGLAPKRKKEVRNPRVKKRKKFEEKKKKLRHMKATYSGGEGRGGYKGELTGIKTGLIRSRKL